MFKTTGKLDFHTTWAVAWVDGNIANYYRALLPKYYNAQRQKYNAHVTVVSKYDVMDRTTPDWKKYQGDIVTIYYNGVVKRFGNYFGLDAWSEDILRIKREFGLKDYAPGFSCFHITIGNCKEQ